jgi:hypothetical protein
MLKRKPIDTYIRRATAGLPRLERVDTAAEIRVHLLQKTRELMAQGFPREEAEHLAVQEMGPVAATNRALIGHVFTSSLGWVMVGLMLASAGAWTYLERDWIFWKDTTIRSVPLNSDDLQFAMKQIPKFSEPSEFKKFEFVVPRGVKTVEYAIITRHAQKSEVIFSQEQLEDECTKRPPSCIITTGQLERTPFKISLVVGEGQQKKNGDPRMGQFYRGIALETRVTPQTTGMVYWSGDTKYWSSYVNTQNFNVYSEGVTTLFDFQPKLNTWQHIWSTELIRQRVKRDQAGMIVGQPKQKRIRYNGMIVAIRFGDKPESQLKYKQLRTMGDLGPVIAEKPLNHPCDSIGSKGTSECVNTNPRDDGTGGSFGFQFQNR